MAELYTRRPLFPGTSEIDQIYKICSVLGTPSSSDWSQGQQLATSMNFKFPRFSPTHLSQVLGSRVGARGISLIYSTLTWNPAWRSSAQETLKHSYFRVNSQPSSANSNTFSLSLRPSRSRRSTKAEGERVPVAVVPVEPVYEREGLRNYKDPPANQNDQDDLKQLLESLKSSDVMSVQHKPRGSARNQHPTNINRANHRGANHLDVLDSPSRRFSYAAKLRANNKNSSSTNAYVPSSFGGPPPRPPRQPPPAARPSFLSNAGDKDSNQNPVLANGTLPNGLGPKIQFKQKETVSNYSSKLDITSRLVESFSEFQLGGGGGPQILNFGERVHKVQSLPELKSDSLLVGRKALHSRPPFSTYLPSQLDNANKKPLHVRTDWKAKYLK